jgi:hypothetical protein
MSDSGSDSEAVLFGSEKREAIAIVPEPAQFEQVEMTPATYPDLNSDSRIVKLPSSALTVGFSGESTKAANTIQTRTAADGTEESNTRLIQWEDGSWSMVVGSEHFRVIERSEDVSLFHKQDSGYNFSLGSVGKQFNVIPASLDSRTHRHVVEQSAVARKLNETRKVALAHGLSGSSVNTISVQPEVVAPLQKRGQKLTAAFLEAGMGGRSVRDIKNAYKRPRGKKVEESESERDSDVDFIDDEDIDDESSGSGSDSESSSSGSSSSSSSSSSSDSD